MPHERAFLTTLCSFKNFLVNVLLIDAILFLLAASSLSYAEPQRIDNDHIVAKVTDDGTLSLETQPIGKQGGHVFVPELRMPWPVRDVHRYERPDREAIDIEHTNGWTTRISLIAKSPFARIETTVLNQTASPFDTKSIQLAKYSVDCGLSEGATEKLRVVGTGGLTTWDQAKGSYTFSAIADPKSRRGVVSAWLTHERGIGVFFPQNTNGKIELQAQLDFGKFRVNPRKKRPTEILLIGYFDDARIGLERYADSVAEHYEIQLADKPGVYCTWYHAGASDERSLAANTDTAARDLKPFGLSVMQIDDKWQKILPNETSIEVDPKSIKTTGPIKVFTDSNENYPSGMAKTAKNIADRGMVAGIWFMPFAGNLRNPYFDQDIYAKNPDGTPFHDARWSGTCIDLSHPKGEAFVRQRVRRIYEWGYRYFKIDGMHTGIPSYNIYVNTSYKDSDFGKAQLHDAFTTHAQAYRKGLRVLREEAPETFILGCNVSQNMRSMGPAFGLIDAMRIGPDNGAAGNGRWNHVVLGAWHGSNLYFLNGRVWHNDPDPVYVRAKNPIDRARWMCSWMAVTGSLHTSSEQYNKLRPERLEILKRCLPSHSLDARPVDYLETDRPRIWLVSNSRMHLIGLFNWKEKESDRIRCNLERMGLDSKAEYVGFDFWANRSIDGFRTELDQTLAPATCRILALRKKADHPQVLSTSRHITQGLIDVESEEWNAASKTLSGESHVVAGDAYELRVTLPSAGTWKVQRAQLGEEDLQVAQDGGILRLEVVPRKTGKSKWSIRF